MSRSVALLLLAACAAPRPPPAIGPSVPALLDEARAARAAGDDDRARAALEVALHLDPSLNIQRLELAEVLLDSGTYLERAAQLLDEAGPRPGGARLEQLRGTLLELQGDDAGATEAYARSLSSADDPDLRQRRATVLARLGRTAEAIDEQERACERRVHNAACRLRLADLYEGAGRVADAEAELLAAAQFSPGQAAPLVHLERFYARTGQPQKQREAGERVRALERRDRTLRPLLPSRR